MGFSAIQKVFIYWLLNNGAILSFLDETVIKNLIIYFNPSDLLVQISKNLERLPVGVDEHVNPIVSRSIQRAYTVSKSPSPR